MEVANWEEQNLAVINGIINLPRQLNAKFDNANFPDDLPIRMTYGLSEATENTRVSRSANYIRHFRDSDGQWMIELEEVCETIHDTSNSSVTEIMYEVNEAILEYTDATIYALSKGSVELSLNIERVIRPLGSLVAIVASRY
jgi:hypothetical protein